MAKSNPTVKVETMMKAVLLKAPVCSISFTLKLI